MKAKLIVAIVFVSLSVGASAYSERAEDVNTHGCGGKIPWISKEGAVELPAPGNDWDETKCAFKETGSDRERIAALDQLKCTRLRCSPRPLTWRGTEA